MEVKTVTIIKTKDEQAQYLARRHKEIDPGIQSIFELQYHGEDREIADAVHLLELNESTIPVGIQPVYFPSSPKEGLPFATIVIEILPDEAQALQLPNQWKMGRKLA